MELDIKFSYANDPNSWSLAGNDGGVITCVTSEDAKKAEKLFNKLSVEISTLTAEIDQLKENNSGLSDALLVAERELGDRANRQAHRADILEDEVEGLKKLFEIKDDALQQSVVAIDDWLNVSASDLCDSRRVREAKTRINEEGLLSYIANVQTINRKALITAYPPRLTLTRKDSHETV